MPDFSIQQFGLVYNAFSFTFAAMFATFIFLLLSRNSIAPQYRGAITMSALVVAIAGYHYFRIFESWDAAFVLTTAQDGLARYTASGIPFNDAYRYIDWLLTVPLLVAELIAVMTLAANVKGVLTFRLALAAVLMVILGYPGEISTDVGTRALWGFLSTIPFAYIVYELFVGLGPAIQKETGQAKVLLSNIRLLLLATWGFYPIVYLLPILVGTTLDTNIIIAVQIGYCIADVAAKCGYGIMIYAIARVKSQQEGYQETSARAIPAMGD
jgi:bacteriorhodopsin